MNKRLRIVRKDRRSIIILFAVLEFITLMIFAALSAISAISASPLTESHVTPWNNLLQIETLAPKKLYWDQNDPVSVTLRFRCMQDCSNTTILTEPVIGPGGDWITRTTTTTMTVSSTQLITQTVENMPGLPIHQKTTTIPLAPFWIQWNNQVWVAHGTDTSNPEWMPQIAVAPTVNGLGEQLLIRRVSSSLATTDSATQPRPGVSLPIELESKTAAFFRLSFNKFIAFGPFPLTILIAVGGIWMEYLRQRDEQSREKLDALQKLSEEKPGDIELLEAFIFHRQLVLPSSSDIIEEFGQLRKKILDPDPLLFTLSSAYERYYQTGEDLLEIVVAHYSSYQAELPRESLPSSESALEKNLQRLSKIHIRESPPLERLRQVLEIWDEYQISAYTFAVHKILNIWQCLATEDDKRGFHVEMNQYYRSQLYLSPVLEEIRKEFVSIHWYDRVFPFQDVFTHSQRIESASPAAAPLQQPGPSSKLSNSESEQQKALIAQLKLANPFGNSNSLAGQGTWLESTWVPPINWPVLVQSRAIHDEQHLLCSADKFWDVHAALCQYASELSPAGINHTFLVPMDLSLLWTEGEDDKQPILRNILKALAGGWAALIAAQPVSFLNLTPPDQVLLMELGTWAAGSLSAWESWLIQKEQDYQFGRGNQTLQQLSQHMVALQAQVQLPSDPARIPAQALRWLTLRPVELYKTYLIFTLPHLFTSDDQEPVSHPGLSALLNAAEKLLQQQIYLRGFIQSGYLEPKAVHRFGLPLTWSDEALLSAIETCFKNFRENLNPQKPIHHFGNLFTPHSSMAVYPPGKPYPKVDYQLVKMAKGSLGHLIFLSQKLLRTLTEDESLDYLEDNHITELERNNPYDP